MYLRWRFLNGHWGRYLKCHKYVHSGQAQTYQGWSKPLWGLGSVLLHLSTSTSLCRSTGLANVALVLALELEILHLFHWCHCFMYLNIFQYLLWFFWGFFFFFLRFWTKYFVSVLCQECCYSIFLFIKTMHKSLIFCSTVYVLGFYIKLPLPKKANNFLLLSLWVYSHLKVCIHWRPWWVFWFISGLLWNYRRVGSLTFFISAQSTNSIPLVF